MIELRFFLALILLAFSASLFAVDSTTVTTPTSTARSKIVMTVMHMQPTTYPYGGGTFYCTGESRFTGQVSKFTLINPPSGFPASGPYGLMVYYCNEPVWQGDIYYEQLRASAWVNSSNPYCGPSEACSTQNTRPPVIGFNAWVPHAMFVTNGTAGHNFIYPNSTFYTNVYFNRWYPYEQYLWRGASQPGNSGWTETGAFYYVSSSWPPTEVFGFGWNPVRSIKMDVDGTTIDQSGWVKTIYATSIYYYVQYDMLGKTCYPVCNASATDSGAWYHNTICTIECKDQSMTPMQPSSPWPF